MTPDPLTAFRRVPVATYRLQLGRGLDFDAAADLVPYLDALGVTDCYTSPFFETASASSHGYDIADHHRFREALGGEPGFARFAEVLKRHGMGLVIDIVPNHMGIAKNRNALWWSVLEQGASSPYAHFFDIDWTPVKRELEHKVLLPILGDQYGAVLDRGELRLELRDGAFTLHHHDTTLPIAPRTSGQILGHRIGELEGTLGGEHPAVVQLKGLITLFAALPPPTETDPERLAGRQREIEIGRRRLADLLALSGDVRDFVEANVRIFNGIPGDSRSFDLLDRLLGEQAYRLSYWRIAAEEINYRRFFDINELAAIRMEDPTVFAHTHRLVFRLVGDGIVTGLRIDHPDGLYAPAEYLRRLQRSCLLELARRAAGAESAPDWRDEAILARYDAEVAARPTAPPQPFYIVAEKILAHGEPLAETWAVAGTTGYEFLNLVNGVFVDRRHARAVDDLYARLLRTRTHFGEIVYQSKRWIMETAMASEINMLAHRLNVISEKHRSSRDFTLGSIRHALREIIACFPVYRTYFGETLGPTSVRNREYVHRAVAAAKSRTPALEASVFDWISDLLMRRFPPWANERDRQELRDFVARFQQITGPVTAKGVEDTALYRYHRLTSLNEVGGDPARFGASIGEFHAAMAARRVETPEALSATSTHDTKRGEDVRARINVLSEIPREWRARVGRWQRLNKRHRTDVDGQPVPGPNEEYLLYQTLVGAWSVSVERLRAYMEKATREAREYTSWINPNARYEAALASFVEAVLDRRRSREFLRDFQEFQARVAAFGALNSLAQVLIKVTAPGVPDFYQGSELWDLDLVDPDNRRPVDFALLRRELDTLLARIESTPDLATLARELLHQRESGHMKMYLTRQALAFRRARAALFQGGEYRPLEATGPLAEHVCAFARVSGDAAAATVVPRLLARRGGDATPLGLDYWADTAVALPEDLAGRFRNVFTGAEVGTSATADGPRLVVGDLFADFPVALLERRP